MNAAARPPVGRRVIQAAALVAAALTLAAAAAGAGAAAGPGHSPGSARHVLADNGVIHSED
jgi:hypothetical protein